MLIRILIWPFIYEQQCFEITTLKCKKMPWIIYTQHCNIRPGVIFIKPLRKKTEVKGKLWHWTTTKPENITVFKDYDRMQIQFCISLRKLF